MLFHSDYNIIPLRTRKPTCNVSLLSRLTPHFGVWLIVSVDKVTPQPRAVSVGDVVRGGELSKELKAREWLRDCVIVLCAFLCSFPISAHILAVPLSPSLSPPSSATLFMAPQAFLTSYAALRSQYSVLNQGVISLFKVIVFCRLIKWKNVPLY